LFFPSRTGAPRIPENLRKRVWAPAPVKAGVRHVRIHSLRHFYASALIALGENIKYISSQLGHASVQITVDRCGHLFPDERRAAAGRFEQRLSSRCSSGVLEDVRRAIAKSRRNRNYGEHDGAAPKTAPGLLPGDHLRPREGVDLTGVNG
jgi:hypothetical protein